MSTELKPDFISTVEWVSFRKKTISDGLRTMADFLDQEGLSADENVDVAVISYDESDEVFAVSCPAKAMIGKSIKDLK